ncbi:putative RNA-binding protein associated with RNAse of E/G family [Peribacillus simplex]|nr:putative RNA-binding protein associated with RNAse of E/G family [Peribacillus simplex]
MMDKIFTTTLQRGDEIIERKTRYDSFVVEHTCLLLKAQNHHVVLFHEIMDAFTMKAGPIELNIPTGSYTIAYYWKDRPYNLYIWRDNEGNYLGSYFNIVKNTYMADKLLSFEDLIIDIMVLPDGSHFILDEEELPVPLEQFESGSVKQALNSLLDSIDILLSQIIEESGKLYKHYALLPWLNNT